MPANPIKHLILSSCLIAAGLSSAQQPEPEAAQADMADGLYNRAKNLYNAGNSSTNLDQRVAYFTKASEVFKDFLDKHPRDTNFKSAEYYYALCFYNTGNIENAKSIFTTIISNQRNGPYVAAACSVMASDAFTTAATCAPEPVKSATISSPATVRAQRISTGSYLPSV